MPEKMIAVIGAGYWGKNLVRNFHELGILKTVCDGDQDCRTKIQDTYPAPGHSWARFFRNQEHLTELRIELDLKAALTGADAVVLAARRYFGSAAKQRASAVATSRGSRTA